jgi:alpha-tubulin suppressor-like RCC1 family protein
VFVQLLPRAVTIVAGTNYSCASAFDGITSCWGNNALGQLGNGTTVPTNVATRTSNTEPTVSLAAGLFFACSATSQAIVKCWGINSNGQLGIGTFDSPQLTALQAVFFKGGIGKAVAVAAGSASSHACALMGDGGVFCWGFNLSRQVGDPTQENVATPFEVASFRLNIEPEAQVGGRGPVDIRVVAVCNDGEQLQVHVTLEQETTTGTGVGLGECTGAMESYLVRVPAHGRVPFASGPATVTAEAVIRERGAIVSTQEWTRDITLGLP